MRVFWLLHCTELGGVLLKSMRKIYYHKGRKPLGNHWQILFARGGYVVDPSFQLRKCSTWLEKLTLLLSHLEGPHELGL